MAAPAIAVYKDDDAPRMLASLGIRLEWLDDAIRAGFDAAINTSTDEPSVAAGFKNWMARVGTLRQRLREEADWVRSDQLNIPLVRNPEKTIALGVMLGNEITGFSYGGQMTSKRPMGPAYAKVTAGNHTLPLLSRAEVAGTGLLEDHELAELNIWFLLINAVPDSGELHVHREVSLPAPTTEGSKITSWLARILLPPMNLGPVVLPGGVPGNLEGLDVLVEPL
ncbi:MAG TPA: hypothetical protein VGR06_16285 [Actinophytocola sp.]|uniref:hypothetical protein n=1 Tax=Actinophytocola sp. TaxID=1872138 RepID=UPI002E055EFE|nr:hypothetical protein [Actinophytocola sp.]